MLREHPFFTEINSKRDAQAVLIKKDSLKSVQEKEAMDFFLEKCTFVEKMFSDFKKGKNPSYMIVSNQIKDFLRMLKTHKKYLLNFSDLDVDDIDYSISQSVKTAILTIAMGETLEMPIHKLINLGVAAILHRIGTIQIPQNLFYADRSLTKDQRESTILFPVLGFRCLKASNFPVPIQIAILEHRENLDGSGYPRGISGDGISLYGKVLSIASAYCAIVSKRPYREGKGLHQGMVEIIREKEAKYDQKIIRILLLTLTVYPIGTYVLMNDGSTGIVTDTHPKKPKYPTVKLVFDYKMIYYADEPVLKTDEGNEPKVERALTVKETKDVKQRLHSY